MFHQVWIRDENVNSLRSLWQTRNPKQKPDTCLMKAMAFGSTYSPSAALFVIKHNAKQFEPRSKQINSYKEVHGWPLGLNRIRRWSPSQNSWSHRNSLGCKFQICNLIEGADPDWGHSDSGQLPPLPDWIVKNQYISVLLLRFRNLT